MPKKRSRVFSRAFKLAAVRRMMAGEDVSALSRELQILRKDLYYWRARFRAGGPETLRGRGRSRNAEVISEKPKGCSKRFGGGARTDSGGGTQDRPATG